MFFGLFKDKAKTDNAKLEKIRIKSDGLHCSSCAVNIDLTLEEIPGVVSAKTSYARSETSVEFDPKVTTKAELKKAISDLGYKVVSLG